MFEYFQSVKGGEIGNIYRLLHLDKTKYTVIIDEDAPDYLLVMISHIIYNKELWKKFIKYYANNRIIIFYADEAISPDLNIFDYAITFDDSFYMCDRVCRHPTVTCIRGGDIVDKGNNLSLLQARQEYSVRRFCNFIYSNSYANKYRDELFYDVNSYKTVDALGTHLHNCDAKPTRNATDWFEISIKEKSRYRFSICAENSGFRGYTSEKILSAFAAHSVPIYWGNNNIEEEFNPRAFINCHRFKNKYELLKTIRKINEDEDLWCYMVKQPWQTYKQKRNQRRLIEEYESFTNHIFEQDVREAKRVPQGTAVWNYNKYYLRD